MIKKLLGLGVCLVVSLMVVSGTANALIGVGVLAANYGTAGGNITGYGVEIQLPFSPIPLLTTQVEAVMTSGSNTAGTYNVTPILLKASYKFPFTPIYVGGGVGTALFSQAGYSVPSPMIYDVFIGYEQNFAPLVSGFVQVSSENMEFKYSDGLVDIDQNFSGTCFKGGVRFGL